MGKTAAEQALEILGDVDWFQIAGPFKEKLPPIGNVKDWERESPRWQQLVRKMAEVSAKIAQAADLLDPIDPTPAMRLSRNCWNHDVLDLSGPQPSADIVRGVQDVELLYQRVIGRAAKLVFAAREAAATSALGKTPEPGPNRGESASPATRTKLDGGPATQPLEPKGPQAGYALASTLVRPGATGRHNVKAVRRFAEANDIAMQREGQRRYVNVEQFNAKWRRRELATAQRMNDIGEAIEEAKRKRQPRRPR